MQRHSSEDRRRYPPPSPPQGRQILAGAARHPAELLARREGKRGEKREGGREGRMAAPLQHLSITLQIKCPCCTLRRGGVPAHKGGAAPVLCLTSVAEHRSRLSAPLYWNSAQLLQLLPCAAPQTRSSEIRITLTRLISYLRGP